MAEINTGVGGYDVHTETHRQGKGNPTTFSFNEAFDQAPQINPSRYSGGSNGDYGNIFTYTYSTTGCEIRVYGDGSTQGEVGIYVTEMGR